MSIERTLFSIEGIPLITRFKTQLEGMGTMIKLMY